MWSKLRCKFVQLVYADHNRSAAVRQAVAEVLKAIPPEGVGLNVGAGGTRVDPRVRNLDIVGGPTIDIVASAEAIPLANSSVDVVLTQETLEHVADPFKAMSEIARILKSNGILYLQVPFIIGYHPGPTDYWRFSREGIVRLVEHAGLRCERLGVAVGASTGFYRIAVEYSAIFFSVLLPIFYMPLKAFFALVYYPIKWMDWFTAFSSRADRTSGGYYVIARKPVSDGG